MSGTLRRGQGLTIGYFAQHQLDSLRLDETPLQHLRRMAPDTREQELRDFLGKFRFSEDQVNELVEPMSGGEKARLALALIAWEKPNLLVLDEPTNHLDMEIREALTIALSTFGGSVLIVSHDRHLLRAATETLWLVRGGHVSAYDGDLDDYAELVLSDRRDRAAAQKEENRSAAAPVVTQKEARREAAKERARIASLRKPVQKKIDAAEKRMAEIDARAAELDAQIADTAHRVMHGRHLAAGVPGTFRHLLIVLVVRDKPELILCLPGNNRVVVRDSLLQILGIHAGLLRKLIKRRGFNHCAERFHIAD